MIQLQRVVRKCLYDSRLILPLQRSFGSAGTANSNEIDFKKMVDNNRVVVFMKGDPDQPRCGFSNVVVQILRMHGVKYDSHDVLMNEGIREGIKEFTNWPTIPQVFMNGEFVGGCDILLQMHQSGDLVKELQKCGIESLLVETSDEGEKK